MTTDLIKTLEELDVKATKGEWVAKFDSCDCGDGYGCSHGSWTHEIVTLDESLKYEKYPKLYPGKLFCKEVIDDMTASVDDGKLIAELRNSLPQIISALKRGEMTRILLTPAVESYSQLLDLIWKTHIQHHVSPVNPPSSCVICKDLEVANKNMEVFKNAIATADTKESE